jgi:hypothetical protein
VTSAGVQTYRILVGRPMVRRGITFDGWYVAIRYASGNDIRYSPTQAGAMELGRAAVRNAMFCRCSEFGPIYMRLRGRTLRSIIR